MIRQLYCKQCENSIGEMSNNVIKLNFKRVDSAEIDYKEQATKIKCRKCSSYLKVTQDTVELDVKRMAERLLDR